MHNLWTSESELLPSTVIFLVFETLKSKIYLRSMLEAMSGICSTSLSGLPYSSRHLSEEHRMITGTLPFSGSYKMTTASILGSLGHFEGLLWPFYDRPSPSRGSFSDVVFLLRFLTQFRNIVLWLNVYHALGSCSRKSYWPLTQFNFSESLYNRFLEW